MSPELIAEYNENIKNKNFENIEIWCRYCGAEIASGFCKGPWGSKTLCTIHYVQWAQKKSLDLSKWKDELPLEPIAREENTEFDVK